MYKKCRFELVDEPEYHPFKRFISNHLAEKLVKTLRTNKIDTFRRSLGFNVIDVFNTKEQSVLEATKEVFGGEDIATQYTVLDCFRIDLYFEKCKIAIEVDEYGHCDRDEHKDTERQEAIKERLGCVFIRINPDVQKVNIDININKVINIIYKYITKSNEELIPGKTKRSLKDDVKSLLKTASKFSNNDTHIATSIKRCKLIA